jgi:hypothetical protein
VKYVSAADLSANRRGKYSSKLDRCDLRCTVRSPWLGYIPIRDGVDRAAGDHDSRDGSINYKNAGDKDMLNKSTLASVALAGLLSIGTIATASAAPLALGYSQTYNGTTNVLTGSGAINALGVSSSSTYGHTFDSATQVIPETTGLSTSVPGGFGFYDDFLFTVPAASANSIVSTIGLSNMLGIENLQVRLYNAAQNTPLPVLGTPNGIVIEGWTALIAPGSSLSIISPSNLSAGTYVLEVRGNVTGSAGGSYSGVLNVSPVPVPGALWFFGSALGGMLALRRQR